MRAIYSALTVVFILYNGQDTTYINLSWTGVYMNKTHHQHRVENPPVISQPVPRRQLHNPPYHRHHLFTIHPFIISSLHARRDKLRQEKGNINSLLYPTNPKFRQQFTLPKRQDAQLPSYRFGLTATRSPSFTFVTRAPISVTTPLNSWPSVTGILECVIGCGVVGTVVGPVRYSWRSVGCRIHSLD